MSGSVEPTKVLLPLCLLAALVVPACAIEEKICEDGKVVVETDRGGVTCEDPAPDDQPCPDDQILLKNPDARVEGCIPNVYRSERYTNQLTQRPSR